VPPPSAAAGDIDIDVPDEPEAETDTDTAAEPAEDEDEAVAPGYEAVGGDDAQEERAARRFHAKRRYKIQEVIKVRQILLVQVVKEERGNKGAALTTYLSLAGRYCVLMPNTARGGGISRKITNAADRKKLKEISSSITVPQGAGLIIRTAGAARTKTEIKRDYEYLLRQWEQIRDLTLKSIAPAPIYEEASLIKRAIRDLYSREMDEILVDGERGYREAKDYMKMLMPSHAKNVKHYADALPLFSRFQVESYLSAMFNPVVQLKSGGYIVIDVTEALVAIDVNSGRATREASIEDTALKTNMEAAEEAARQMRLRDLAGLIVIDFIDMEDRRNNAAVEKRLKEKLKSDRARIQVGRISPFGLLEMSRQRLRPGMIEATTKSCPHCHGTGRVRSDDSMALALLREIEEEGVRQRSKEVLIVAPVEIANYLLNQKREHIAMIEARFGLSVRVEGDPSLISPDYRVERFKTASRVIPTPESLNLPAVAYPEAEEEEDEEPAEDALEAASDEKPSGKRKRRRRRRGGRSGQERPVETAEAEETPEPALAEADAADVEAAEAPAVVEPEAKPKSRRRSRGSSPAEEAPDVAPEPAPAAAEATPYEVIDLGEPPSPEIVEVPEADAPQRRTRERVRKPAAAVLSGVPVASVEEAVAARTPAPAPEPAEAATDVEAEPRPAEAAAEVEAEPQPAEKTEEAPKRRGWWSRALGGS
jgi:ribonuclease E